MAEPNGTCVDPGVPCNTGCKQIHSDALRMPRARTDAYLVLLDASDPSATNCTDLHRAYIAVQAGATGVVIIAPKGQAGGSLSSHIDPETDDLLSIRHINVPVGKVSNADGAPLPRARFVTRRAPCIQ